MFDGKGIKAFSDQELSCADCIDVDCNYMGYRAEYTYWFMKRTINGDGVPCIDVFKYVTDNAHVPRRVYKTTKCKKCKQKCIYAGEDHEKEVYCFEGYKPITNSDKLNRLSVENLVKTIEEKPWCNGNRKNSDWCMRQIGCYKCIADWMEQEV